MSGRVLVTLRYRSDVSDAVWAWGTGADFADAIVYLARHSFVVTGLPFDEPMVLRIYQGARAERRLTALELQKAKT